MVEKQKGSNSKRECGVGDLGWAWYVTSTVCIARRVRNSLLGEKILLKDPTTMGFPYILYLCRVGTRFSDCEGKETET